MDRDESRRHFAPLVSIRLVIGLELTSHLSFMLTYHTLPCLHCRLQTLRDLVEEEVTCV
jgi:hypothetical protein